MGVGAVGVVGVAWGVGWGGDSDGVGGVLGVGKGEASLGDFGAGCCHCFCDVGCGQRRCVLVKLCKICTYSTQRKFS